jgi:hypothetical protein
MTQWDPPGLGDRPPIITNRIPARRILAVLLYIKRLAVSCLPTLRKCVVNGQAVAPGHGALAPARTLIRRVARGGTVALVLASTPAASDARTYAAAAVRFAEQRSECWDRGYHDARGDFRGDEYHYEESYLAKFMFAVCMSCKVKWLGDDDDERLHVLVA